MDVHSTPPETLLDRFHTSSYRWSSTTPRSGIGNETWRTSSPRADDLGDQPVRTARAGRRALVRSTNVRMPASTRRSTLWRAAPATNDPVLAGQQRPGSTHHAWTNRRAPSRPSRPQPPPARKRPRAKLIIRSPATTFSRQAAGMAEAPQRAPASWPAMAAVVSASSPRFAARSTA